MKKTIIASLLLILSLVSIFSYKTCKDCKKMPFETAINKEYIYLNNGIKTNITLTFSENGIFGFGGVNRYFAGYKVENNNIKFSPIGSTMMAGSEENMQLERRYFDLLNNVEKIKVFKSKIVLCTKNNKKMKFIENKAEELGPKVNNTIQKTK